MSPFPFQQSIYDQVLYQTTVLKELNDFFHQIHRKDHRFLVRYLLPAFA